ncbi:MAG: hypothetical protein IPH78_11625 [Bacteroidetes bacterium]|nr:hypothetical protein [Bacteroidota bacterium]
MNTKMEMLDTILVYGFLTSFLLTILILGSLYVQPRIWMQDLPIEVRQTIPAKTKGEKQQTLVVLILFLLILILIPSIAVIQFVSQPTFFQAWCIAYAVYFIFNLTDLLFIDWLVVCTITPNFIKVKGVDEYVYKNYAKHLKDFMKGMLIIIVPSLLSGSIGFFIAKYSLH